MNNFFHFCEILDRHLTFKDYNDFIGLHTQ